MFPQKFKDGVPDQDLPMFPRIDGGVVQKEDMVSTIEHAAAALGTPLQSADGGERISGHTLRVTGAQGLARAGVECWAIQLLGRWGSDAVLGYVRAIPLERSAGWARRVALERPLESVLAEASESPSVGARVVQSPSSSTQLPAAAV